MRLPSYEELSKEQDAICVFAPLDGATLVSGPPGTGKTVVAFYRAAVAAEKKQTPRLIMYNKVLRKYSSNASKKQKAKDVDTFDAWFGGWWKSVFGNYYPQVAKYSPDWQRIIDGTLSLAKNEGARRRALERWGHLIIDEGQDFANGFYDLAALILYQASVSEASGVALTVLADENQRINADKNSSLSEIEKCLCIPPGRHYFLRRNYRNTFEIARAAAHFYCGLRTGIPDFPEGRHGNVPRMVRADDLDASVDMIRKFVENQSDLEVAVFLPTKTLQKEYYNKLKHRLKGLRGVRVQRYTSDDKNYGDANALVFDQPGTVTVLCDKSSKGLEFDAVFIPEIQSRNWDPAAITRARMEFYVLASRARHHLTFLYSAGANDQVPILAQFPGRESNLLEWSDG